MFYRADWIIKASLEGDWPSDTFYKLDTAMQQWWGTWNESAEIIFGRGFGDFEAHTDNYMFDQILDFSANGDLAYMLKNGCAPLTARSGFDPALHQALLSEMKNLRLSIKYIVEDQGENFGPDEYIREVYKVTSNG